jgi:hypothetical protein
MAQHLSTWLNYEDIMMWSKPSWKKSVTILLINKAEHLFTGLRKEDILR